MTYCKQYGKIYSGAIATEITASGPRPQPIGLAQLLYKFYGFRIHILFLHAWIACVCALQWVTLLLAAVKAKNKS